MEPTPSPPGVSTIHTLGPDRRTLHGHFSRDLTPVLSIDPGDRVHLSTLDAGWGLEPPSSASAPRRLFSPRDRVLDGGHALCGPIEVRGAQFGMTLEVSIDALRPGGWGWTRAGGFPSPLNQRLGVADGPEHLMIWTLDSERGTATNQHGRTVALRPFLGVIGMPPPERGTHPTFPPRIYGGNIDCKELVAGSRLFLPIPVAGALLSVGDGHAAQGDGEVSGIAIECPMERVELTIGLEARPLASGPYAVTPSAWVTFGFHEKLDEAVVSATHSMLQIITARLGVHRKDALALASVAMDLRVTQVVNGVSGIHAVLAHDMLG